MRVFVRTIKHFLNNFEFTRCNLGNFQREYSVFPPNYIKPTFKKDEQQELFQSEKAREIAHERIKPALTTDTCSEFYDGRVLKFINTLMRNGDRNLALTLVTKAFEGVKRMQLQRYHNSTDEEKNDIELDPFVIFHRAVDNCMPVLCLVPARKGGITYQVPIPLSDKKAQHRSMKWLIEAANEKADEERFYDKLAKELVSASQHQGLAVKWKQELHKKCQDNRAYAHFRWI